LAHGEAHRTPQRLWTSFGASRPHGVSTRFRF